MTTDNLPQLPPSPAVAEKQAPRSRLWPLWLLCLLIAAAVAALAWAGWQQLQFRQTELNHLEESNRQQSQRLTELERQYQERLTRLDQKAEQAVEQVHRLDKQLSHTSQQVLSMGAKGRTDWLLAEAEYLLRLANQRLQMERDPKGALAILQAADQVLAETDDIAVYPVRRQIAQEVLALQSVAELDRTGVFLKIDALTKAIDQLQQRLDQTDQSLQRLQPDMTSAQPQPAADGWRGAVDELWRELKQLVVVRRLDEPVQPLLPPENVFFLRQNLRLMLEQAELALLEKNQVIYDSSLDKAEEWVRRYFSAEQQESGTVAEAFLNNLRVLRKVQVNPSLPDTSESLRLLKSLVAKVYETHQVPAPGQPRQAPSQPSLQPPETQGPKPEEELIERPSAPSNTGIRS